MRQTSLNKKVTQAGNELCQLEALRQGKGMIEAWPLLSLRGGKEVQEPAYQALCSLLNIFNIAIFILSPDAAVLFANEAAKEMAEGGWPVRCSGGYLSGPNRTSTDEIATRIKTALADKEAKPEELEICFPHSQEDKNRAIGYLRAVHSGEGMEPALALFIISGHEAATYGFSAIAQSFGLSKAEKKVLKQLMEARTLAVTASRLNISLYTVKSHMRKLFQKTNTSNQAELLRLVERFRLRLRQPVPRQKILEAKTAAPSKKRPPIDRA